MKRKLLFFVLIVGVFLFVGCSKENNQPNGNTQLKEREFDLSSVDISKVKLSFSEKYNYFNNEMTDFAAVLVNSLKKNEMNIKSNSYCKKGEVYVSECYKVVLNNDDTIYIASPSEHNFFNIIIRGKLTDKSNIVKIIDNILKLYNPEYNNDSLNDEINNNLITNKNENLVGEISYIISHLKCVWTQNDDTGIFEIDISPNPYESNKEYLESDKYKEEYTERFSSKVETILEDKLTSYHTINKYEVNKDTKKVDVYVKYEKSELTKSVCASDAQYYSENIDGEGLINFIEYECINKKGTFYYVRIFNFDNLNKDNMEDNTKYYNSKHSEEKTSVKKLEDNEKKEREKEYECNNALEKAESYSSLLHMSKAKIYDQLVSKYGEGFSKEAAKCAVDQLDVDWKENALEKAKSYRDTLHMSKSRIYDQLISSYGEKFTKAEAKYAIDHLYD